MDTIGVPVSLSVAVTGPTISGQGSLISGKDEIEATASAVRQEDGSTDKWALDLVTARLLRSIEEQLMERVHERIDRCVSDE